MNDVTALEWLEKIATTLEAIAACLSEVPGARDSLTVAQVAKRLGCCEHTARQLIKDGKLPAMRVGGRRGTLRVRPDDLAAYERAAAGSPLPRRR